MITISYIGKNNGFYFYNKKRYVIKWGFVMTTNEKALQLHEEWNGKLETISKTPVNTREALALAYTPGVAEPCKVIAQDREAVYKYTMKANIIPQD